MARKPWWRRRTKPVGRAWRRKRRRAEALAAMETQIVQPDRVRRGATATVLPAMYMETVQMVVTPGKEDLEDDI